MAWREVGDVRLPVPVAGHPALELCNTRAGWGEMQPKEYLPDLHHAFVLGADLGLLPAALESLQGLEPRKARRVLEQLHRLREDLYAVVSGSPTAPAVEQLNASMLAARRRTRLAGRPPTDLRWSRDWTYAKAVVDAFAESAEQLLRSEAARTIAVCPGTGCGWAFLNASGRRRWCSMRWCGNRAKARRHADRQRETGARVRRS